MRPSAVIGLSAALAGWALGAAPAAALPPGQVPHCRAALPQNRPGAPAVAGGLAGRCAVLPPGCGSVAYTPKLGPPPNCSCACVPRLPPAPGAPAPGAPAAPRPPG